jgi:hypothetical protein
MDINSPEISRKLAILIQYLDFEERRKFLEKAAESPDLRFFLESLIEAKGVKDL